MAEVRDIPWNGLTVASTFSGAGGSCLGYRMAGFRVVWANEFVPIAQESYLANADPCCHLDRRDIRLVQPEDILTATGLAKGELDIFDGSPPCQAFSVAGKREKGWGKGKRYEHGAVQCNEQLFDEYIRLLAGLMPRCFVAENVAGLVRGKAKGFFLEILKGLRQAGYRVECRLLDAKFLGVPQSRPRTIFVGVRSDINKSPAFPRPLPYVYATRDALPHCVKQPSYSIYEDSTGAMMTSGVPSRAITASGHSQSRMTVIHHLGGFSKSDITNIPSAAITATQCRVNVQSTSEGSVVTRKATIDEIKSLCSFPDDFVLKGSYAQQWERLGNSVPPLMMRAIASTIANEILLAK